MKLLLVILLLVSFFISCKKERIDVMEFFQCNNLQKLDSVAIINKLIGNWKWAKQSCGDGNGKIKSSDKNVIGTFNNSKTFTVSENSAITSSGNWRIQKVDVNSYGLVLSQPTEYLSGRILFCDNEVLFNDNYRDGCDNLFTKIN